MKILLIEDEPMNTELFRAVLERDGHLVAHEGSGLIGRARALGESFDLIISDIDLPGIDGHALCRDLREAGVRCPIVALTAFAGDEEEARAKASGFDLHLTKPLGPKELRRAIDSVAPAVTAGRRS